MIAKQMSSRNLHTFNLLLHVFLLYFFFFNDTATTEIYTLSLHDALPISREPATLLARPAKNRHGAPRHPARSEEHTSELQSHVNLVCRLLLEKKNHMKKHLT